MNRKLLAQLLLLAALLLGIFLVRQCQLRRAEQATTQTENTRPNREPKRNQPDRQPRQITRNKTDQAPAYALEVLRYVRSHDRAPQGYVGGRDFQNRENKLPKKESGAGGHNIHYREWDVHPKVVGQDRGPERLVTGSDGSAWYTADHYRTFLKLE